MSSTKILFIIGAGKNIGAATARKFSAEGYKVILGSRSIAAGKTPEGYFGVPVDVSKPAEIAQAFETVHKEVGVPSVVLYNAATLNSNPDPLGVPLEDFTNTINTNLLGAFAAAQQAALPAQPLTFLYTGNKLNTPSFRIPGIASLGVGKAAAAHLIENLAMVHGPKGVAKFYYVDERTAEGGPAMMAIDGDAHAEHFWKLVQDPEQAPVLSTFAKGVGYKKFE